MWVFYFAYNDSTFSFTTIEISKQISMRLNIFCATTPFTKIQNQQRRRYNYSIILQGDIIITQ